MTLQIEPPAPGTALVPARPAPPPAPRRTPDGRTQRRYPGLVVRAAGRPEAAPPRIGRTCLEPLDRFSRRAYASAGVGFLIAAAAAAALHMLGWSTTTKAGQMLACLLTLGFVLFCGGAITGSLRPSSHLGGDR